MFEETIIPSLIYVKDIVVAVKLLLFSIRGAPTHWSVAL
jgi:hypothetical protein